MALCAVKPAKKPWCNKNHIIAGIILFIIIDLKYFIMLTMPGNDKTFYRQPLQPVSGTACTL